MKKTLIVIASCLISLASFAQSFFNSSLKMGDTKVYLQGDEIIMDYFHGPAVGIGGIGRVSWAPFSWDKVDEFVYKKAIKSNYNYLWIVIRYATEDQYGNKGLDKPITIGKIDVREAKKYVNFSKWHSYNSTYEMWAKDKASYDADIERRIRNNTSHSAFIVPTYRPKSIR